MVKTGVIGPEGAYFLGKETQNGEESKKCQNVPKSAKIGTFWAHFGHSLAVFSHFRHFRQFTRGLIGGFQQFCHFWLFFDTTRPPARTHTTATHPGPHHVRYPHAPGTTWPPEDPALATVDMPTRPISMLADPPGNGLLDELHFPLSDFPVLTKVSVLTKKCHFGLFDQFWQFCKSPFAQYEGQWHFVKSVEKSIIATFRPKWHFSTKIAKIGKITKNTKMPKSAKSAKSAKMDYSASFDNFCPNPASQPVKSVTSAEDGQNRQNVTFWPKCLFWLKWPFFAKKWRKCRKSRFWLKMPKVAKTDYSTHFDHFWQKPASFTVKSDTSDGSAKIAKKAEKVEKSTFSPFWRFFTTEDSLKNHHRGLSVKTTEDSQKPLKNQGPPDLSGPRVTEC